MTPLILIPARGSSTRFPGKVYQLIGNRPMWQQVRDRAAQVAMTVMVWAERSDLPHGDVLGRLCRQIRTRPLADPIVRVTSDCPLWEPALGRILLDRFVASSWDWLVTASSWDGVDVEIATRGAWLEAEAATDSPHAREHPFQAIMNKGQGLIVPGPVEGALDWSVDVPADLEFVQRVYEACPQCAQGTPRHSNAAGSVGGTEGRHVVWELHDLGDGGLTECTAWDLLDKRRVPWLPGTDG